MSLDNHINLDNKINNPKIVATKTTAIEPPFDNEYWDNHSPGIYVDIISGEPLFSSIDKFDSGTGWPTFTKPIDNSKLEYLNDSSLPDIPRTEIKSKTSHAHLGHFFDNGPAPTRTRYCINSSSLKFIEAKDLFESGYPEFITMFGSKNEVAILAGGCFWGVEALLKKSTGIIKTIVGYSGGKTPNPDYELVRAGLTNHAETVAAEFDPSKTSYENILKYFFKLHDPTTLNQQGNDIGSQYRSVIFYLNEEQYLTAKKVKALVEKSNVWLKPPVTEILPFKRFYKVEDFHQNYLNKNPNGYTCHFLREHNF